MKIAEISFLILLVYISTTLLYSQGIRGYNTNSFTIVEAPSIFNDRIFLNKISTNNIIAVYDANVPEDVKPSVNSALQIWSSMLLLDQNQTITVSISWQALSMEALAKGMPSEYKGNVLNAPLQNVLYPIALAEKISQQNLNQSNPEIIIIINNAVSWYKGTDGKPNADHFDLVSVILHEMGHGLGYDISFYYQNSIGAWGTLEPAGVPTIYDVKCTDGNYHNNDSYRLVNTNRYPNSSAYLGFAITSDNVYFDGDLSYVVKNNSLPKLYSPTNWEEGMSICHLDESSFPAGDQNSLMTPGISQAEVIHTPGDVALAILKDLGWSIKRNINVSEPIAQITWEQGSSHEVKWYDNTGGNTKIQLYSKSILGDYEYYATILTETRDLGWNTYSWTISNSYTSGEYRIKFLDENDEGIGASEPFRISNLPQVEMPQIIPPWGRYTVGTTATITMTCATDGAEIHYTTDGSMPSLSSDKYTSAITINQTTEFRAQAYKTGYNESPIVRTFFVFEPQGNMKIYVGQMISETGGDFGQFYTCNYQLRTWIPWDSPQQFHCRDGENLVISFCNDFDPGKTHKFFNLAINQNTSYYNRLSVYVGENDYARGWFRRAYNTTLQSLLIDGDIVGDTIEFKDPWLNDQSFTGRLLNGGSYDSKFYTLPSPAHINTNSTPDGSGYKGVFLNIDNEPCPKYKVRTPMWQTFNDVPAWFIDWKSALTSTFIDPTSLETVVSFHSANDVINARYKGHLLTSTPIALGAPSRIKYTNYTLVYESGGAMWQTTLSTDGAIWGQESLLGGYSNSSTIYRDPFLITISRYCPPPPQADPMCYYISPPCYEKITNIINGVGDHYAALFNGLTYDDIYLFTGDVNFYATPSADYSCNNLGISRTFLVWRDPTSGIRFSYKYSTDSYWYTLSYTTGIGSTNLVLKCYDDNYIMIYEKPGSSGGIYFYRSTGETKTVALNTSSTTNINPVAAIDANNNLVIAWIANAGNNQSVVKIQKWSGITMTEESTLPACPGTTGYPVSVSLTDRYSLEKPNDLTLVYTTSGNDIVAAHYLTDSWTPPFRIGTGMNATLQTSKGCSTDRTVAYLTGTSAPYSIQFLTVPQTTLSYNVPSGWNMLSVPVEMNYKGKDAAFPAASSFVFGFNSSGYVIEDQVSVGKGYWVKYTPSQTIVRTGDAVTTKQVSLTAGWNLVGSISTQVPVDKVVLPDGVMRSSFWAFSPATGYVSSPFIDPGKAYWLKVSQACDITLHASAPVNQYITNCIGTVDSVYSESEPLPSAPPSAFQVSPAYGAEGVSTRATLRWSEPFETADSFKVCWSADPDFDTLVWYSNKLTDTQYTFTGLSSHTTYYWYVKTYIGANYANSATWKFTSCPTPPTILSPTSDIVSNPPTLRWRRQADAISYRIQISLTSDFLSIVRDTSGLTDTVKTITGLAGSTMYYWRVCDSTLYGPSEWSFGTRYFKVTPPPAPVLTANAYNTGGGILHPKPTWTEVTGWGTVGYKLHRTGFAGGWIYTGTNLSYIDYNTTIGEGDVYVYYYVVSYSTLDNVVSANSNTINYATDISTFKQGIKYPETGSAIPTEFALYDNFPNPFNPTTTIYYALPKDVHVKVAVYNVLGKEVATLVDGTQSAGYKTVAFDASDLPSGVYYYRLQAGTFSDVKKMVLVR